MPGTYKQITLRFSDSKVQIFDEWVEVTLPPTDDGDFDPDKSFTLVARGAFEVRVSSANMITGIGANIRRNQSGSFVCCHEGWVRH